MPIYEYKCDSCGKIFTKIQKFADEPLTVHEECGSGPVERLISTPAFHFVTPSNSEVSPISWYTWRYFVSTKGPPVRAMTGEQAR